MTDDPLLPPPSDDRQPAVAQNIENSPILFHVVAIALAMALGLQALRPRGGMRAVLRGYINDTITSFKIARFVHATNPCSSPTRRAGSSIASDDAHGRLNDQRCKRFPVFPSTPNSSHGETRTHRPCNLHRIPASTLHQETNEKFGQRFVRLPTRRNR